MPSARPTARAASCARRCSTACRRTRSGNGNPFKYGFIGDTDTHNAAASHEEFNYTGKFAFENDREASAATAWRGSPPAQVQQIREFSSGGLAGVWAEENTRESIFDAMQRKETFGTSGPMIKVRFFGELGLHADDLQQRGLRQARATQAAFRWAATCIRRAPRKAPTLLRDGHARTRRAATSIASRSSRAGSTQGGAATRSDLRRRLERRPQAGHRRQAAAGRRHRRRRDTRPTRTASAAPSSSAAWTDPEFEPGERALLLRARARDPDAALEHARRRATRCRDSEGAAGDDPGTRVEFADLVHAGLNQGRSANADRPSSRPFLPVRARPNTGRLLRRSCRREPCIARFRSYACVVRLWASDRCRSQPRTARLCCR